MVYSTLARFGHFPHSRPETSDDSEDDQGFDVFHYFDISLCVLVRNYHSVSFPDVSCGNFLLAIHLNELFISRATMYPGSTMSLDLIRKILNKAYWPIYGEMKILDEIEAKSGECSESEDGCPDPIGSSFSFLALMAYMIVANVLLINLLIAMFRLVQC